ncbi:chromosome partitioning protein [Arthrobacter sp. GAS37]|uniref:ParA family protein n=1 Tax=Arthrobacter sp. GAS37 TaxID=3156261 RepID=UPI00383650C2
MSLDEDRIIAVANNKGGVLKTSVTANVATILAMFGLKVLVVDLDPNGHIGLDLGFRDKGLGDDGASILNAIVTGAPLQPIINVRPNLDVVPGGKEVKKVPSYLASLSHMSVGGDSGRGVLRKALAEIAPRYDFVLLDTPPGDSLLQQEIYLACRWLLFVTKSDRGSLEGLNDAAQLIAAVIHLNPYIEILGAVVTDVDGNATAIKDEARQWLQALLGDAAPAFTTVIRHVQKAANTMRDKGRTAIEVSRLAQYGEEEGREHQALDKLYLEYLAVAEELVRRFEQLAVEARTQEAVS